jgi:type II secretion system protein J
MVRRIDSFRGFTLLELLVAMSLMVVAASCLYTALYTGFRARRSATAAVEPTAQALNAIELLKQDVVGVIPIDGVLADSFIGVNSRGSKGNAADSVTFYTTQAYAEDNELVGGISKIELVLEEDTDEGRENFRLVRKITRNLLSPRNVDPEEQVLCRNVKSLDLRYFDGDAWYDEWDSTADSNSLPLAMEVEIEVLYETNAATKETEQTRRLLQSFAIPCGGDALASSESETTTTSTNQGASQTTGQMGG